MIVQEVKVAGTKPMTIVMKSDVKSIDEVVVTGYQEIDRRKLASSISSIKGADLIGGEYLSIDKMLQGRLPGVAVMNMSSTPELLLRSESGDLLLLQEIENRYG